MTNLAGRGESGLNMIGVGRGNVFITMAIVTFFGSAGEGGIVAGDTFKTNMRAGERE